VTEAYIKDGRAHILQDKPIPPYVTILRIHGPFLFGATSKLEEATTDLQHFGPVIILRLRNMTALDGTGLHALEAFAQRVIAAGRRIVICGARRQPFKLIRHSKLIHIIGRENIVLHVEAALARARAAYAGFENIGPSLVEGLEKCVIHPGS
jgi:sulfate permease, SulP family